MRTAKGYTLIEILVVIAIMLLLVAVTLPAVKYNLDESKVREASRQLNSYIAMAKARAASTGRPCGIWLVSTQVGQHPGVATGTLPPETPPDFFQCTELYLCEVPAAYCGDFTESRVTVNTATGLLTFQPAASNAGLYTLVADGETFTVQFDNKGPEWYGYRNGTACYLTGQWTPVYDTLPRSPPTADANGYAYRIIRHAVRTGSPLALPRGTAIDLSYCGFGSDGTQCYAERLPAGTSLPATAASQPAMVVLFASDGHVSTTSYRTFDKTLSSYRQVATAEPQGTLHLLVGKQMGINQLRFTAASNIADSSALWVSTTRLTGSVASSDNAPDSSLNPVVDPDGFIEKAREFAIIQDVKGGQ